MGDRQVLPDGNGWKVVKAENDQASARAQTQDEAIERAREIIQNEGGGELVIHGKDGKIREKRTLNGG